MPYTDYTSTATDRAQAEWRRLAEERLRHTEKLSLPTYGVVPFGDKVLIAFGNLVPCPLLTADDARSLALRLYDVANRVEEDNRPWMGPSTMPGD
jgi:hypothetical protein